MDGRMSAPKGARRRSPRPSPRAAAKSASPRPRPMPRRERLAHRRGGGERDAGRLALLEAQADVLEHVLELEQRRVVVLAHRAGLQGEHRRAAAARAHHLRQRVEVDAGRAARRRSACASVCGVGRGDGVVDELDHLALADLVADVHDQLAHRLEERAGALEVLGGAAGHDRQRPVLGLGARAGHRRVDEADPARRQRARRCAGCRRARWSTCRRTASPRPRPRRRRARRAATSCTCAPSTTIVMTTSLAAPTSAGVAADGARRARRPTPRRVSRVRL